MERTRQFVGLLLDRRAVVPGPPVLLGGAALSFLAPQLDLLQLLLQPLLLQAPQGAQHQRRLALDRRSERGGGRKKHIRAGRSRKDEQQLK